MYRVISTLIVICRRLIYPDRGSHSCVLKIEIVCKRGVHVSLLRIPVLRLWIVLEFRSQVPGMVSMKPEDVPVQQELMQDTTIGSECKYSLV